MLNQSCIFQFAGKFKSVQESVSYSDYKTETVEKYPWKEEGEN